MPEKAEGLKTEGLKEDPLRRLLKSERTENLGQKIKALGLKMEALMRSDFVYSVFISFT